LSEDPEQPNRTEPIPFPAPVAEESIADGVEHQLDPNWITAARLTAGITVAILAFVTLLSDLIILISGPRSGLIKLILLGAWLLLVTLLGLWGYIWPGLRHRYASYRLDDHGIRIRRGVIWRSVVSVPRSRVQHTDVSQGPLERGFGLATLVIHTAGTENASVTLPGLPHAVSLQIRDYLIGGGDNDAV